MMTSKKTFYKLELEEYEFIAIKKSLRSILPCLHKDCDLYKVNKYLLEKMEDLYKQWK